MKTVMKKMFCLMLVAVLMVGVMPFSAFADEAIGIPVKVMCGGQELASTTLTVAPGATESFSVAYGMNLLGANAANYENALWTTGTGNTMTDGTIKYEDLVTFNNSHDPDYSLVMSVTEKKCDSCDGTLVNHIACPTQCLESDSCQNAAHKSTCTAPCNGKADCAWTGTHKTSCLSLKYCEKCKVKGHTVEECPKLFCSDCGAALATGIHNDGCIENCKNSRSCTNAKHVDGCPHAKCDVEGCILGDNHTGGHEGVHCEDANCTYPLSHGGKHSYQCPVEGCQYTKDHGGKHSNEPKPAVSGKSDVIVYINLYTGSVKTNTYEIIRFEDISSETVLYSFLADRESQIRAKIPSGYGWTGHIYNEDNKNIAESTAANVGTGSTVHINAYSEADYVYIYVHRGKTYVNDRVIQMDGKKVGETIKKSEVSAIVDDYYRVNTMEMYGKDAWASYMKGNTVQDVASLTAEDGITEVHVVINSNAGTTSSTTYTADTTNPKTGDMIFAPAAILGLSASALAVLFFLNKKRAVK